MNTLEIQFVLMNTGEEVFSHGIEMFSSH